MVLYTYIYIHSPIKYTKNNLKFPRKTSSPHLAGGYTSTRGCHAVGSSDGLSTAAGDTSGIALCPKQTVEGQIFEGKIWRLVKEAIFH